MTTKTPTQQADTLRHQIARYLDTVEAAPAKTVADRIGKGAIPSPVVKELNAMRTDGDVECEQKKGELHYWLAKPLFEIVGAAPSAPAGASALPASIRPGTRAAQVWAVLGARALCVEEIAARLKQPKSSIAPVLSTMHKDGTAQREQGAGGLYRYTRPGVTGQPAKIPAVTHGPALTEAPEEARSAEQQKAAPSTSEVAPSIAAQEAEGERDKILAVNAASAKMLLAGADEIERLQADLAAVHELLADALPESDPRDPSDLATEALARIVVAHLVCDLRNARALADKLQHLFESKTHECEALRAALDARPCSGEPDLETVPLSDLLLHASLYLDEGQSLVIRAGEYVGVHAFEREFTGTRREASVLLDAAATLMRAELV